MSLAEQPPDWRTPGAYAVTPGVHRIPLRIDSPGLHAVNVYVLETPDGLTLVDSGWAGAQTTRELAEGLRWLGYALDDVAEILVTHAHWDHYSEAISLRRDRPGQVRVRVGHAARLDASLAEVRRGAGTAYAVAAALRWTRRARRLPELDDVNAMMAVLEIEAHLDVLADRGLVSVTTGADGVRRYTLSG